MLARFCEANPHRRWEAEVKGVRIAGIDLLRGIAAFGIVGCHLSLSPRTAGGEWVTVLCDFNVGVFAAIAGLLMGWKNEADGRFPALWSYGCVRAKRLLPTYFFWSVVFVGATCVFDLLLDGGRLNPKCGTLHYWLNVVFLGGAATHLWFLPCLLYSQIVLRLFSALPVKGIVWVLLGLLLIAPSAVMGNWFGTYPLRLFSFLVTGYGLGKMVKHRSDREIDSPFWGGLTVAGLVMYVLLSGIVPSFIRGWFATIPLLIFFVSLPVKGCVAQIASALGATSMGVYLIHPLLTRGLSVIWSRVFPAPFGVVPVVSEWMLAWVGALLASFLLLRIPYVGKLVR